MRLGRHDLGERVLVVAEIGNNHEGDAERARALVDAAADAGADAVKFQTFGAERLVSPVDPDRLARLRSFELAPETFAALSVHARSRGLLFLSTPLDLESACVLEPLVDAYKIASGDNDFTALLELVASMRKPVVVSGGMSTVDDLRHAIAVIQASWDGADHGLAVLHCVSAYPAPADELHLRAIPMLARELGCTIGYSDHSLGLDAALLSVALGARIVEKHFTLDKQQSDFRDHALSSDPDELRELVERVRLAESMLGREEKSVQPSEEPTVAAARRSVAASRDLPIGHRLGEGDVTWLRPAGGLRPGLETEILGRTLLRGVRAGEPILLSDVG